MNRRHEISERVWDLFKQLNHINFEPDNEDKTRKYRVIAEGLCDVVEVIRHQEDDVYWSRRRVTETDLYWSRRQALDTVRLASYNPLKLTEDKPRAEI